MIVPASIHSLLPSSMHPAYWVLGGVFVAAQVALLALTSHRAVTLWRLACHRPVPRPAPPPSDAELPRVTVQLPIYNERRVAERVIAAAGALDWPIDLLEIQVLDDSTDDTRGRVDRAIARLRERGLDARVHRRRHRAGWKAGALAAGLAEARGEWIAVFDADFVPEPDFLRRLAPHFADPRTGLVQARWGHLDRDGSRLTAAQAVMLDAHFRVEQEARMRAGFFLAFNGTAGAWRRACIEQAGGWSHDTLTEDLDLSYRAQLAGWRFVYDGSVVAPAELPDEIDAFRSQQRRWARGSIQTARKILPRLWLARLALRLKLEATAHLLGHAAYPLLFVLALLLGPLLFLMPPAPRQFALALELVTLAVGLLPVAAFLAAGQRGSGRSRARIALDILTTLVLGAGLAFHNGLAALEGLRANPGEFERTPKSGGARSPAVARYPTGRRGGAAELVLAAWFAFVLGGALVTGRFQSLPFLALLVAGFTWVGWRPWGRAFEAEP